MNGVPGPPIWHQEGLQHGNSLSLQLFVLQRAHETDILAQLHPQRLITKISLYADDVMLFCHATESDVSVVKEILALFGRASGLKVNYAKSYATVLHGDQTTESISSLGCPVTELPITYLGIPLTTRRPSAAQLQPLVDKVADCLPIWKAWLMNKAGRLALVKFILCAIPVHQLLAFAPPKKTLQQVEKLQRGFLCSGHAMAKGGHCHVTGVMFAAHTSLAALDSATWSAPGLCSDYNGSGSREQTQHALGKGWTSNSPATSACFSPHLPTQPMGTE